MTEAVAETVALLLAAGESRRMGSLKALLPWQGRTLLAHQITALAESGISRIVVVLGHRVKELAAETERAAAEADVDVDVEWVLNPDYRQGKTTSIKAGLKKLSPKRPSATLIVNVDQPRSAETLAYLLQQRQAASPPITIPTYAGKGGHPIIFDGALLEELIRIDEETQGLRAVVERHKKSMLKVEMDAPEILWDLNTPEQYRAALSPSSSLTARFSGAIRRSADQSG